MIRKETYREMAEKILALTGGAENIKSLGHCSLRLRLSLKEARLARVEELEQLNKVKKVFWAENQLQLALGFGLVTRVYDALFEKVRQGAESGKRSDEERRKESPGERTVLFSPVNGEVRDISASSSPSFASGTMGPGAVFFPEDGLVTAPCDGEISFVFPSSHALGMRPDGGPAILIHCGVDTVKLNGEGFTGNVRDRQRVKKGDLLLSFDRELIEKRGFSAEILLVCPELEPGLSFCLGRSGKVSRGEETALIVPSGRGTDILPESDA